MAVAYCYEGIPLRFLASLFDIDALSSVYEIFMINPGDVHCAVTQS